MYRFLALLLLTSLVILGCGRGNDAIAPATDSANTQNSGTSSFHDDLHSGCYLNWGLYDLEIARDGSYSQVVPIRTAGSWGLHLNAVKFLETHPCTHCLSLSNIHLLDNGDLSVDVTLTHPWPDKPSGNLYCTGFDVKGIIMFPASQYFPDNDLRILAGLEPFPRWKDRYSSEEKGDAELMNPDGWLTVWAPDADNRGQWELEEGLPIFEYYPGRYSSGENLGTINAFKDYWTNENRHMFEVGKSATRTYIIRPPAEGPIEASYAVYAHWAAPTTFPVTNPAEDFPPCANSPLPYEFWITQDEVLDPDAPSEELGCHIHWHVKMWDIGRELWGATHTDTLYARPVGGGLKRHPSGEPDEYYLVDFFTFGYEIVPDALPGEWPYIFFFHVDDPEEPWWPGELATAIYIKDIAIDAPDGQW